MLEAKQVVDLKALLRVVYQGNVTQYQDPIPIFRDPSSSTPASPEIKINEKGDGPPPTHVDYSKMLHDHKNVADNNLLTDVNMLLAHFDRLYGKMVHQVDASISQ